MLCDPCRTVTVHPVPRLPLPAVSTPLRLRPWLCYAIRRNMAEDADIARRLELLRMEHRDLDAAISALGAGGAADQLQLARLKKRKLRLRDEIAFLEDQLIPDIIA